MLPQEPMLTPTCSGLELVSWWKTGMGGFDGRDSAPSSLKLLLMSTSFVLKSVKSSRLIKKVMFILEDLC